MKQVPLQVLTTGKYCTQPVFLDAKFILLSPEIPVYAGLVDRLKRWGFSTVLTEGEFVDKAAATTATPVSSNIEVDIQENANIREAEEVFDDFVAFLQRMFDAYLEYGQLPLNSISDKIKAIVEFMKKRRACLLRLTEMKESTASYIVVHSVKTCILALVFGIGLKLPPHRLIDLGTAALLHEIGMLRLPAQLYMSDRPLSAQERKAITANTLLGFKMLKALSYPLVVCMAVLECREHVDGSGYPRNLTGDKISLYAKLIAVCSSYAALSSHRPFRAAQDGHTAMVELFKHRNSRYDDAVLRSFLGTVSLFPIGTWVQLANGAIGMVVNISDGNPKAPPVRVMIGADKERAVDTPTVETTEGTLRIVRSLSPDEVNDLKKRL